MRAGPSSVLAGIDDQDTADIIEFMKALTDERVQCDQAPFDHPELLIPIGHEPVDDDDNGRADDIVFLLPEVGADGYDCSGQHL